MANLDSNVDRLALLKTNNEDCGSLEDYLLLPLSGIDSRQIRAALDSVQADREKPQEDYLSRSVKAAQILLLLSLQSQKDADENSWPLKHILVLTSNPSVLGQDICGEDNIQVHVLCPQPAPMGCRHHVHNNGWLLQSRDMTTPIPPGRTPNEFEESIAALIMHARVGSPSMLLTKVSVTVSTNKRCSLKAVAGATQFLQLHPGETATVLIKAKTHAQDNERSKLTSFPRGLRTPSGLVDLERELDMMLSEATEPGLSVKVRYSHPALPDGTVCEVTQEVTLPTQALGSREQIGRQHSFSTDPRIQGRQIFHVATHKPPKDALAILRTHMGSDGASSVCKQYIRSITDELKYRARLHERFDIATEVHNAGPRGSNIWGSTSARSVAGSSTVSTARRVARKSATPPNATRTPPSASPARPAPLRVAARAPSNETIDHARRIWIELRRKTKGTIRNNDDSPEQEERLKHIKQVAAQNRRSIGNETLKSMALGSRKENVAPWL